MASLAHFGKALKDRCSAKSLATAVIRHGSGSRGRDVHPGLKNVRSDMIGCSGAGAAVPLSPSGHVRFMPMGATAKNMDTSAAATKQTLTEMAAPSNYNSNSNSAEKAGQGLLYGRRRKRSSETIRHDKLYLQTSEVSKREYAQTWNDFQDTRSIPTTEWGKRLTSDE